MRLYKIENITKRTSRTGRFKRKDFLFEVKTIFYSIVPQVLDNSKMTFVSSNRRVKSACCQLVSLFTTGYKYEVNDSKTS